MSLRLALFWREHGRGSRITCLSSEGSRECWICSMSVTDLAPFRLPLKEVLRESDLTWEGRGVGESVPTRLEGVVVVLTCMDARSLLENVPPTAKPSRRSRSWSTLRSDTGSQTSSSRRKWSHSMPLDSPLLARGA